MKYKTSRKEQLTRLIGIPVVGLLVPLLFWSNAKPLTLQSYATSAAASIAFCFVLWQGNWYIVRLMRSRFPNISDTPRRVAFQVVTSIVYTLLAAGLLQSLVAMLLLNEPFQFPSSHGNVGISLIITLCISSIYESTYFFEQWKKTMIEGEKLKRENLQSQYEMLKSQVNPHFLFNSLNTLITVIPEDDKLAVEFTQKLANVYRYLLQNKDKEVVPLRTELQMVEAYIFLMKIRFGENLQVEVRVPEEFLNSSIPPLTLQMLLENAIKHNIISTERPLHLFLFVEKGNLIVKNNLQKKAVRDGESTKIGLQNIINRYGYLSEKPVDVITTADNFIVALPLLEMETREMMV